MGTQQLYQTRGNRPGYIPSYCQECFPNGLQEPTVQRDEASGGMCKQVSFGWKNAQSVNKLLFIQAQRERERERREQFACA